jgi:hypothetical protein
MASASSSPSRREARLHCVAAHANIDHLKQPPEVTWSLPAMLASRAWHGRHANWEKTTMKYLAVSCAVGLIAAACLSAGSAHAQLSRTWVASNGDNTANCGRANPCQSLQTAHDKTNAGGEINCVDNGDFGSVLINKSITIDCGGAFYGDSSSPFIFRINTPGGNVKLRNVTMNGLNGFGATGIDIIAAASVFIENCSIVGFRITPGTGIKFAPSSAVTNLVVNDCSINDNGTAGGGGGLVIQPTGSGSTRAFIVNSRLAKNSLGLVVDGSGSTERSVVQINDSHVANSDMNGITVIQAGMVVNRTVSQNNSGNGILANTGALVHLGSSTVTGNAVTGLVTNGGGQILSYQNNQVSGNTVDGAPTGLLTLK